jgi:hypothetical protein
MSVVGVSVWGVKQVVKLRVLPSDVEAAALDETLRTCNAAASWLSAQMHAARVFRKIDAQQRFYTELRERFGLAAQPAIRVIGSRTLGRSHAPTRSAHPDSQPGRQQQA